MSTYYCHYGILLCLYILLLFLTVHILQQSYFIINSAHPAYILGLACNTRAQQIIRIIGQLVANTANGSAPAIRGHRSPYANNYPPSCQYQGQGNYIPYAANSNTEFKIMTPSDGKRPIGEAPPFEVTVVHTATIISPFAKLKDMAIIPILPYKCLYLLPDFSNGKR